MTSGTPNAAARLMKTSAVQSVTIVTAGPRRGIRRCTLATTGLSSIATNPATSISSTMSRSR